MVWDAGDEEVDAQAGLRRILDGRADAHDPQRQLRHEHRVLDEVRGHRKLGALPEAHADEELDETLLRGHLRDGGPLLQRFLLQAAVCRADAPVLAQDAGVQAAVLDDGEDVEGHLALREEVEEALHVGDPARLG